MAVIRKRGEAYQAIVRVTLNGVRHEESRSFATERLAKDWASRLEASIKLNGIPQRVTSRKTLGDLLLEYRTVVDKIKPMRRQMHHEIDQLATSFAEVKLNQITPKVFSDFARIRLAGGASPTTILHNLSTVRSALNAAKPVLGVDVTGDAVTSAVRVLERVGAVSKSQSRTRRPTDAELMALRAEFRRIAPHPGTIIPMETIIDLAIALPRRLGELVDMRWEDYRGDEVLLRDTKHPTQVRNEVIPVPPQARAIIDALPKFDEKILPYKSESVSASFERACKRLGIVDLRFHDLRHEGITRLFGMGLGIQEVALISGHKSWAMLKRYTHLTPQAVLAKLADKSTLREFKETL